LNQSGAGFSYPQLLRNEIPLTPTSLGLVDPDSLITRFRSVRNKNEFPHPTNPTRKLANFKIFLHSFRICGKAVLAMVRMKFMVRRWNGRSRRGVPDPSVEPSSSSTSTSIRNSPRNASRKQPTAAVPSWTEFRNLRRRSSVPGLSLSSLSGPGAGAAGVETVLSDYLRRIQSLESEVEGILTKNRPPRPYIAQVQFHHSHSSTENH